MKARQLRLVLVAAAAFLASMALTPGLAAGAGSDADASASWLMDGAVTAGGVVADSAGSNSGYFARNTSVTQSPAVNPYSGTGAYYFNGWDDGAWGSVDATASSVVVPDSSTLDPGTSDFAVSFWMDPRNPAYDPAILACKAARGCSATLNVMQKGMGNQDQWKVSLDADGAIICTFRDADSHAEAKVDDNGETLVPHYYVGAVHVTCGLERVSTSTGPRAVARLLVGFAVDPAHSTTANPVRCYSSANRLDQDSAARAALPGGATVNPPGDMWIGKKPAEQPDRTEDWDTYAGHLDDVRVVKGSAVDFSTASCR